MHVKLRILGILFFLMFVVAYGCSGSGDPTTPPPPGPIQPQDLTSGTVGVTGGSITVSGFGAGLDGVEFNATDAALDKDYEVKIEYYDDATILPPSPDGIQVSKVIRLSCDESFQAMSPVTLTIPYDQSVVVSPELVVGVYINLDEERLTALGISGYDETAGTMTVRTSHLGDYVLFYYNVPIHDIQANVQRQGEWVGCDFSPTVDGFFIPNFGSYDSPGGNCMGMATYAGWYYWNLKKGRISDVKLHQNYRQGNQNDPMDDIIAHEVSIRAFVAVEQIWAKIAFIYQDWRSVFNNRAVGYQAYAALALLQQPQVMIMGNNGAGTHAVNVYKYENGNFLIYDNNLPGQVIKYPFSFVSGFGAYPSNAGNYTDCCVDSGETYVQHWDMKNIYNAAKDGFSSSKYPTINCTSHTANEEVDTPTITLEGNIAGGEHPEAALNMRIFVNGVSFQTPLNNNAFSQEVPLKNGDNSIWFYAYKTYLPQKIYYASFKQMMIKYNGSGAADILVTLNWYQDDTDLDLYVTEPGGETVWYHYMTSASGGELDIDDTDGYGPEHYTVRVSDGDKLLTGDYVIRCHYYSDHETEKAITYKAIVYYNQITTIHHGSISVSNPDNAEPGSTGTDWRDIKTITVAP